MSSEIDKERNEDLNPRSDDIEERVKRMLDPSIPDEPQTPKKAIHKAVPEKPKTIAVNSVEDSTEAAPLSAPVLPPSDDDTLTKPASKSTSKPPRTVIPIAHDTDTEDEVPEALIPDGESTLSAAAPEQAISLGDANETTADIAEKLDAAIAELEPGDKDETDKPELSGLPDASPETDGKALTPAAPAADIPVSDPSVLTDPDTDKAVDAIVADESDKLLEIEDALRDSDEPVKAVKQRRGVGQILKSWWSKPAFRWLMILLLLVGVLSAGAVPSSRYFILNSFGTRAASSLTVLDASTQQPLKNVQVSIGSTSATTDVNGKVVLRKIHLGNNLLTVQKRAFAPFTKTVILGWGSNPLGEFKLTPTGSQYSFSVTDFLSGKPLSKVEASSPGDVASAISDDKGTIKLTIDQSNDQKINITIKGENYRQEQISLNLNDMTQHALKLVPSRKQVFISKRSGKYDIYSVYIDGQDEKLVLGGSGNEREDNLVLVPHPTENVVAYVSNRANQHNSDGFLLSNLILINLDDNTTTNIGASERLQIVDWSKNYLVYVQIAAASSANSPKRYRLMSYNYQDGTSKELASSNFFNDVVAASGSIYYAPSSAYQTGPTNFYKINADGSGSQVVYGKEVWNIFRTAYDHFTLSVQQEWYDYKIGGSQPVKLNSAPANQITQVYIDNSDTKHSAWVDNRDGKGVLLVYDNTTKTDTTLRSQAGLTYPVRWLNNKVLIYRIKLTGETADYAISIDGGEPVKIRDVTNTKGIDRWYYY